MLVLALSFATPGFGYPPPQTPRQEVACPGQEAWSDVGYGKVFRTFDYAPVPSPYVDCDTDVEKLFATDQEFEDFVRRQVNTSFLMCFAQVEAWAQQAAGVPLLYCGKNPDCLDNTCTSNQRSQFIHPEVVFGHQVRPPTPPEFGVCQPEVVKNPMTGRCTVEVDCKIACKAEVDTTFWCNCLDPDCHEGDDWLEWPNKVPDFSRAPAELGSFEMNTAPYTGEEGVEEEPVTPKKGR